MGGSEPRADAPGGTAPLSISNIVDYLLENVDDERVALEETSGSTTYAGLRRDAARVAAALRDLDLPAGSRVGLIGPNSRFWVAAYLAALKLDLVAVPFASVLTPEEIRRNAGIADVAALLVDRRSRRLVARAFDSPPPIITNEALGAATEHWPQSEGDSPDRDAVLLFTSGTTALPRAVRITHRNLAVNTEAIIEYLSLTAEDRVLVVLPFSYCYGASLIHTHLRAGASLALCSTFTYPESAVEMIERTGCTGFAGVPSSLQLLLRASSFGSRPLPSLRLIQQAGGKLPDAQIQAVRAAQPQARLFVMYGQTEATARLSYLPPELLDEKLGSIGRGIAGVELSVLDGDGEPVTPGAVGEIVARGASISPGYFRDEAATAAKFPSGALHTGDLGTVDADGFIYVLDRKDDFIKSWGYRISSQEIEAATLELPTLVAAGVVGIPDDRAGETVVLYAIPQPGSGVTAHEVRDHLRHRLARHMVPEQIHLVESLPLNSNGKVLKSTLREWALRDAVPSSGADDDQAVRP